MTKTEKGLSVIWAKIKANTYALFHMQCIYTESQKTGMDVYYHTTLVATCTGSLKTGDFEIRKVFYETTNLTEEQP